MVDHEPVTRYSKTDRWVGFLVGLIAFAVYFLTLAPTVLEADAGEFQFVPWLPGIAHPTGYPLYVLLGWFWSHLLFPFGEVAWRMNLLSAVLAAVAVGLTYRIAYRLMSLVLPETYPLGRRLAALVSALTFAVSPTFWSQAIVAEVYSLHILFVTALLWLALELKENHLSAYWLSFTLGLSLTHHRTIILLLPALLLFLAFPPREKINKRLGSITIHILLLMAPLLLYLYLPLIAPYTPYASLSLSESQTLILYDNSWAGFWNHITGSVFSDAIQLSALTPARFQLVLNLLYQQVGLVGIGLAGAGVIILWQHRRFDILLLTGISSLSFTFFNLIYLIGDIYVLFIPVWLIVCLWLGLGGLGLVDKVTRTFVSRKTGPLEIFTFRRMGELLQQRSYQIVLVGLMSLFLLIPILFLINRISEVSQRNNIAASEQWQTLLSEPLPPGAILLSNDRNEIMPMWYYQYVEHHRPDLLGLFPLIVPDPAYQNIGRLLDQALASERPVYLIKPMEGLSLKANLTPAGSLYHATAITSTPAHPLDLTFDSTLKLIGYDLKPSTVEIVESGTSVTITLYWQVLQELSTDYTSYVHLIDQTDQGVMQSDHQPGLNFYPSSMWQRGEILRDQHTLFVDLPPGEYRLRVGLYHQPEPGSFMSLGEGKKIGLLVIK